jgi:hypothetical protein
VPSYPRNVQYGQKHSPSRNYGRNEGYGQGYGGKKAHHETEYGMNERRNYVEKQNETPKNDGYGMKRPKQEYNYDGQEKQKTKMDKYGPTKGKEGYEKEEMNYPEKKVK